ncbi:MAG: hypothetical protein ACXVB6_00005, partial [Mucilaginibacter sp.]
MQGEISGIIRTLGDVGSNFSSNLHDTSHFSNNQLLVSAMVRGLTLGVVIIAAFGELRRIHNKFLDLPVIICGLAP